VGRFL